MYIIYKFTKIYKRALSHHWKHSTKMCICKNDVFDSEICKRALVASTEGYLLVAASTPTYDTLALWLPKKWFPSSYIAETMMFQQKNNQKVFSGPFCVYQDLSWLFNFFQFQLMKSSRSLLHSCMFVWRGQWWWWWWWRRGDEDCSEEGDDEAWLCDTDPETFQWIPSHWAGKTIVGHWTAQLSKFCQWWW